MSQITLCPHCQTAFRVVADQLRISDGWVRCGRCRQVFDAAAQLQGENAAPAPLLPDLTFDPALQSAAAVATAHVWSSARAAAAPPAPEAAAQDFPQLPLQELGWDVPQPVIPAFLRASQTAAPQKPKEPPLPALPQEPEHQAKEPPRSEPALPPIDATLVPLLDERSSPVPTPSGPGPGRVWHDESVPLEDASQTAATDPLAPAYSLAPPEAAKPAGDEDTAAFGRDGAHLPAPQQNPAPWPEPGQALEPAWAHDEPEPPDEAQYSEPPSDPQPQTSSPDSLLKAQDEVAADSPWRTDEAPAEALEDTGFDSGPSGLDAEPGFVRKARRNAFWQRPWMRAALLGVGVLLLLALVLQWAHQERDRIAVRYPQTRPWLVQWCAWWQCRLQAPRAIDAVVIDSSSFVKLRGDEQGYQLQWSLRNHSAAVVAMPALELTLTSALDQPLMRRVLLPADVGAPSELAAAGVWSGALSLRVSGASAVAGYRLLAFYP